MPDERPFGSYRPPDLEEDPAGRDWILEALRAPLPDTGEGTHWPEGAFDDEGLDAA